ncbi:site-specific DNA-methyltransferase [Rhodococcus oryzae]|uniref:Site-specific DNA-methyltransferase n=1 Tax=Rhodococcus oryzae TaxID=2571143 RepID=A0ABY2RFV5_9NOCA|nr:DNA methyltransferase [Rhodococcus oryzae]TJZ75812.1 site-specific DNA-methyltransferase [Rhodococcus oryzae]
MSEATEASAQPAKTRRKSPDGASSTSAVLSSYVGNNAPVFRDILKMFVPVGSTVADVTWGKGAFWTGVPDGLYEVKPSDLQMGIDCRDLPYEDGTIDALVLDPPYMEGLFRKDTGHMAGSGTHSAFRERYSNSQATAEVKDAPKWHDAVLDLYFKAGWEAKRVLRNYGIFIVKCQDEVSANRQRLTHIELINEWAEDFYCKDLFVVTRPNKPVVARMLKQEHARKNHSYFLVFVKRNPEFPKRIRPTANEARALGIDNPQPWPDDALLSGGVVADAMGTLF